MECIYLLLVFNIEDVDRVFFYMIRVWINFYYLLFFIVIKSKC